jgi:hypothetical protein
VRHTAAFPFGATCRFWLSTAKTCPRDVEGIPGLDRGETTSATSVNVARRPSPTPSPPSSIRRAVSRFIDELEQTCCIGRAGYPIRAVIGVALAKSMYAIPTWTRTVALVREHPALDMGIVPLVRRIKRVRALPTSLWG